MAFALGEEDAGASMKFHVKGHGELEIEGLTASAVPALRLVQWHAPLMTMNALTPSGVVRVKLADIDLKPSFARKEAETNTDRAQLAKLGG